MKLPSQFHSWPPAVVEAYICGLIPPNNDLDWAPKVRKHFPCLSVPTSFKVLSQALQRAKRILEGRVLTGRIALTANNTLWLDPVEERVTLESLLVTTAISSPQRCMLNEDLAQSNPGHLTTLAQTLGVPLSWQQPPLHISDCRCLSFIPPSFSLSLCVHVLNSSAFVGG